MINLKETIAFLKQTMKPNMTLVIGVSGGADSMCLLDLVNKLKQEKAITLIALVLTIIVLMILVAVGIATLTGDNGILTTAQEARETKKVADIEEQLKLAQLNSKIDKETGKKVSIENYIKELENAGLEIDYDDTTQEGIVTIIIEGKYIYEISQTEKGDIKYDSQGQVGKQKPKVVSIEILEKTSSQIKVKVTTLRNNEGKLRYYIKEENAVDYAFIEEQEGEEYTFDNLNPNKTYSKIKVEAIAGNGESGFKEIDIQIPSLEKEGAIALSYRVNGQVINEADWTKGPMTVTVKVDSNISKKGYTLQTAQGKITKTEREADENDEIEWQEAESQIFITNGVLYARLIDKRNGQTGEKYTKEIANIDKTGPTISKLEATSTTNSITITANATDAESGIAKYRFSKDNGLNWEPIEGTTNTSYTFNNLTQNKAYSLKIKVTDKVGNETISEAITKKTENVPDAVNKGNDTIKGNMTFTYTPNTATKGNVTVTITTDIQGYGIQYTKEDPTVESNWKEYTTGVVFESNGIIYARLKDSTGQAGGYATGNVTNIDKTEPNKATIELSSTSTNTKKSITAQITQSDNTAGSGINITKCKWIYTISNSEIGTNEAGYTGGSFTSNPETLTLKTTTEGTYYLHILTVDNAGNAKETISEAITVEKQTDGSYWTDEVNSPNLMENMTAVYWDSSNTERTLTDESTTEEWDNWYQYIAGNNQTDTKTSKWANAKTSDGSYWVWIPRYEYKIVSGEGTSTAGKIEVKFIPTSQTTADEGYKIHPAFQDGTSNNFKRGEWDKELAGIWVGKYESSNSNGTVKVVPGVSSWRSISIGDMYTKSYNYDRSKESHMMKNSEWGAVAYLTHSQYGRNGKEIAINSSSSYITGTGGTNASTTGNIYGIYDLSGGAWEYVAAYITNGNSNLSTGSSFAYTTKDPEGYKTKSTKYATVYPYNSVSDSEGNNYTAYKNAGYGYGDSILETSVDGSGSTSWFRDYSYFPNTSSPFFVRGGNYSYGSYAGAFSFYRYNGSADSYYSFRVVLARCLAL